MRSQLGLAIFLTSLPGLATAEPWAGIWAADPSSCANAALIGQSPEAPIEITVAEFRGLENTCQITNVTPLGVGESWRLDQSCSGEGTTYRVSDLVMVDHQGRLLRFTQDGFMTAFVRCE